MVVHAVVLVASFCVVAFLPDISWPYIVTLFVPLLLVLVCALLILLRVFRLKPRAYFSALLLFVGGFLYASVYASHQLSLRLPGKLLGVEVALTGTVSGLPYVKGRRLRFLCDIDSLQPLDGDAPVVTSGRLRLDWYGGDAPDLKAGDRIEIVVKLKAPSGFMNPGGFDLERWLTQKKIVATGYVRSKSFDVEHSIVSESAASVAAARNYLQRRLLQASDGLSMQGVVMALAVGDRSAIGSDHWKRFIDTGTNHLLAISGLHISLVAGFIGLLARGLWRCSRFTAPATKQVFSLSMALVAAACYAAMAGFTVPTVRALTMFTVLALLLMSRRHQRRAHSLSLAVLVVCLIDPLSVLAPGFWMSFAAVTVLYLVFCDTAKPGRVSALGRLMRGHVLVSIGLYPLTILFFQQASLIAPFANLLVTPLVGMLVTPLVFVSAVIALFSVPGAATVLLFANYLLEVALSVLTYLSNWPWALVKVSGVEYMGLLLGSMTALVLLIPLPVMVKLTSLLLLLPLLFPRLDHLETGSYVVSFLDVGQGTAVVVRTRDHVLVYDTGDQFSESFSAAEAVIIPYLRAKKSDKIDRLIVSHADRDHSGGADELLDQMDVDMLMSSAPLPQRPEAEYIACEAGMHWRWNDVSFLLLHPQPDSRGSKNDLSCVLKISNSGGLATLLPGDIEWAGERSVISTGGLQDIDILLSPHHGSMTSSSIEFINKINPDYVVHTVGYRNRFDFPRQEVVQRYSASGAQQYRTDLSGAIEFVVGPDHVEVVEYRDAARRWWHRD